MSGVEEKDSDRFIFGVRYLPDHPEDRAKLRTTFSYRLHPQLRVGIEYNPLASDASALVNWLAVSETRSRPALMLGTSSDRIGSSKGESFFFTVSKNLERWIKAPIAPYVGAAYGTFKDDLRPIVGGNIRFTEQLAALIIYDGKHTHSTLSWTQGRHVLTAMLVQVNDNRFTGGVSYSISFDLPKSGN